MHSIVVDIASYDWEGDLRLNRPMRESIIYLHDTQQKHCRPDLRRPAALTSLRGRRHLI